MRPVHEPRSAVRGEWGDPQADLVQAALQPRRQPHVHPHRPLAQVDNSVGKSFVFATLSSVREVFETPGSRHVANLLVREGLAVAAAEGVNIPSEEADHILQKVTS